jgi:sodium transport system ATP-binding protein
VIEVNELRKCYGPIVAVDHVSFLAPDGMVTGLLGPNGAGKTTALRAVAGLLAVESGRVTIDGLDVRRHPIAARARLGVVPEAVGLYDQLTVREHLRYSAELNGVREPLLTSRVDHMLERHGLSPIAHRRAGELSLGQRRRVAVARALVHDPPNIVLDEPTSGLDVPSARQVRRFVRECAQAGCAVVFSSHVMPEVSATCDRIVILSRGSVVAAGTPTDILERTGRSTLEDAFVTLVEQGEERASHGHRGPVRTN